MSIVSEQLIGGGNLKALEGTEGKNPFPKPPEWETPSVGFGGYRYAADSDQASLFGVDAHRVGPKKDLFGDTERSTKYGGEAGARPMEVHNTLLGQLGQYINPTDGSDYDAWGTTTYSKEIAHSIMSSGQMRSLKDTSNTVSTTRGRPIYNSSGGGFTGYDQKNTYGISSWSTEGVEAVEGKEATKNISDSRGSGSTVMNDDGVEEVVGVDASNQEIFSPTNDINTGLRQLPVAPTA